MGTYSTMSANADTNIGEIGNSLSNIKNVSFDGVWSGDAFNSQNEGLTTVLTAANTLKTDLERFSDVLAKLETYKALKEEIDALTEEINSIVIPSKPESAAAEASARKSALIAKRAEKIEQKNQLRQRIETMLATFKAIDSQIKVINYDIEQHKDYLEYLADINGMTLQEFMDYVDKLELYDELTNLLPKNNSDIAHRGFHPGGIYENSVEAFEAAGLKGFWGAEADVRFDANGNLVCSHNAVQNGENPATFEEYLDICKKYGMTAIIDLKYENGIGKADPELSAAILQTIEEKGMMDSCVIQTNNFADIPSIRSQSEDARIWLLGHNSVTDDNIALAKEYGVECINFNSTENNSYRIQKVTEAGIDACVWNVQTEGGKQSCLNAGATYVMSDNSLGISPYQEGDVDFNAVKGNYGNSTSNLGYTVEGYENFVASTNPSTNTSTTSDNYTYTGPILTARAGRMDYVRTDGVTVQESWCQIPLENSKELADFYKFDGDKVVEGTKISDMEYWVRDDGVQMIGDYVAVATDVIPRRTYGIDDDMGYWDGQTYNYGDVVETTLGKGIVMGVCTYAVGYREQYGTDHTNLEIYTLWHSPGIASKVYADDYVQPNYANDPLLENR